MRKFVTVVLIFFLISCEKETTEPVTNSCDIRGTYTGTAKDRFNTVFANTYHFLDNNYVTSSEEVADPENAFGGYRNTCDSVVWNTHNNINDHKYVYRCVPTENRTRITGTYQDLDNPIDMGTLDVKKQ